MIGNWLDVTFLCEKSRVIDIKFLRTLNVDLMIETLNCWCKISIEEWSPESWEHHKTLYFYICCWLYFLCSVLIAPLFLTVIHMSYLYNHVDFSVSVQCFTFEIFFSKLWKWKSQRKNNVTIYYLREWISRIWNMKHASS